MAESQHRRDDDDSDHDHGIVDVHHHICSPSYVEAISSKMELRAISGTRFAQCDR